MPNSKIFLSSATHKYHNWFVEAESYNEEFYDAAEQDFLYKDSKQWNNIPIKDLQERGQQPSTFNLIRTSIDAIMNVYFQRDVDFRWVGVDNLDSQVADIVSSLSKKVDRINSAQFIKDSIAEDGFTCGIGWGEFDYGNIPMVKGKDIAFYKRDPLEMGWDPFGKSNICLDYRYVYRKLFMDLDIALDMFGEKADSLRGAFPEDAFILARGQEKEAQLHGTGLGYIDKRPNSSRRIVLVDMEIRDDIGDPNIIRRVLFTGNVFLRGGPETKDNDIINKEGYFNKVPYFSSRDYMGRPVGVPRHQISMQDLINGALSKWLWNISSRQLDVEKGAANATDLAENLRQSKRPDGVRTWNPNALKDNRVRYQDNIQESSHLINVIDRITGFMDRSSGISDALRGQGGTNARSFAQEDQRARLSAGTQSRMLRNFDLAEQHMEKVKFFMMARHYDTKNVFKVFDKNDNVRFIDMREFTTRIFDDPQEAMEWDILLEPTLPYNKLSDVESSQLSEVVKSGLFPPEVFADAIISTSNIPNKSKHRQTIRNFFAKLANGVPQNA